MLIPRRNLKRKSLDNIKGFPMNVFKYAVLIIRISKKNPDYIRTVFSVEDVGLSFFYLINLKYCYQPKMAGFSETIHSMEPNYP